MAELAFPILNTFILGSVLVVALVDYMNMKREKN